jgi:hypothetical protein
MEDQMLKPLAQIRRLGYLWVQLVQRYKEEVVKRYDIFHKYFVFKVISFIYKQSMNEDFQVIGFYLTSNADVELH